MDAAQGALPRIGGLSLDEAERRLWRDWQARLGATLAGVEVCPRLVRGLLVCALEPENPVWEQAVEAGLRATTAKLREQGRTEAEVQHAFYQLSVAVWDVVSTSGAPLGQAVQLTAAVDRCLLDRLDSPLQPAPW